MTRSRRNLIASILLSLGVYVLSGCIVVNEPPIASFTRSPDVGEAPLSVFFDAGASVDVDGVIVSYSWAFGDGATGEGETVTHTYSVSETYETLLTVTDDGGKDATAVRAIQVTDPATPMAVGVEPGQAAPTFTLKSMDGPDVSLSEYLGRIVLLDFWRSTCPPCRLTMPHLESLRAKYADQGLVVVTVNLDTTEEQARYYLDESGLTEFIVLRGTLADATAVRALYAVEGLPRTFLIDRQGIIRYADHPIRLRDWHIEPWL